MEYEVEVTYASVSCVNLFDVTVKRPVGVERFCLKEKLIKAHAYESMVWADENEKMAVFYQRLGGEIEEHLRINFSVILLDASRQIQRDDEVSQE